MTHQSTSAASSTIAWCRGLLILTLLACPARAQEHANALARAQDALESARSARQVRALAPAELDVAERALERALAARRAGQPRAEIDHLAYLAERHAAIAHLQAERRKVERALEALSAAHRRLLEARRREARAASRRAWALAQRLRRFDVGESARTLVLTPREDLFAGDVLLTPRARRAIAAVAEMLDQLPERKVLVEGYAGAGPDTAADVRADRGADTGSVRAAEVHVPERDALALARARADVVRAFLITGGVDPRRIIAGCHAGQDAHGPRPVPAHRRARPDPGADVVIFVLPAAGTASLLATSDPAPARGAP